MNIKDMIYNSDRTKKVVTFVEYFNSSLWYTTECGFLFPVPISEIENSVFAAVEPAPLFMRYIRKHMDTLNEAKSA